MVLVAVYTTQQLELAVFLNHAGVVAGCHIISSKRKSFVQKFTEFDLPVAHDIRVWRAPLFVFLKKICKYFIVVFFLKIDGIVRDVDLLADTSYIL
ncbi:hypothetical protein D3C76_961400 [compost metagenome]